MNNSATKEHVHHCPSCSTALELSAAEVDKVVVCPNQFCSQPFKATVPEVTPENQQPSQNPHGLIQGRAIAVQQTEKVETVEKECPDEGSQTAKNGTLANSVLAADRPVQQEEEEHELLVVPLSAIRRHPLHFFSYVILGSLGLLYAVYYLVHNNLFLGLVAAGIGFYFLFRLLRWLLRLHHTRVRVTNRRTILETSNNDLENTELYHKEVSEVESMAKWHTRFTRVGDLILISRGEKPTRLYAMGVLAPEETRQAIERHVS